jgi:hypothetical protein
MTKLTMTNKCTSFAGRFNGHGGAPEQYRWHGLMGHVPGLLWKPLDAGIGQLLTPYYPSSRQGNRQTNNNQQIHINSWPF